MNAEELFKKVFHRFHSRGTSWISGYVHGVQDEAQQARPTLLYLEKFGANDDYSNGYVYGFVDARGEDVAVADWFPKSIGLRAIEWKWWNAH